MIFKLFDDILVGGFKHFLFFHMLGISSSQLTNSYFSEGWLNHQAVFFMIVMISYDIYFCCSSYFMGNNGVDGFSLVLPSQFFRGGCGWLKIQSVCHYNSGWWFGTWLLFFHNIWDNPSHYPLIYGI